MLVMGAVAPRAAAHDHPSVLWPVGLGAPLFTEARDGYGDLIRRWFIKRLERFEHSLALDVPLDRALDLMRRQDGVCHPLLFRTEERIAFAVFSKPVMMTPSLLLLAPQDAESSWLRLDDQGVARRRNILASRTRAVAMTGRRFGDAIDQLIVDLDRAGRLQTVDEQTAAFAHLSRGWADFTFGYASEIEAPYTGGLKAFPIEGAETGKLARIACSGGPMGRAVISAADDLISAAGPKPVWLRYYTNTLDDAGRAEFERALERRAPWGSPSGN